MVCQTFERCNRIGAAKKKPWSDNGMSNLHDKIFLLAYMQMDEYPYTRRGYQSEEE